MTFNPDDLYVSGGNLNPIADFTASVYKFDSSSFYNWEQDNLPLFDLEDRTQQLWERTGYVFSSTVGMNLVLSSTIPSAGHFTTMSSLVEAIPNDLRFPILIEIAKGGDLGELNLRNIRCTGAGAIEIINRVYARSQSFAGRASVSAIELLSGETLVSSVASNDLRNNLNGTLIHKTGLNMLSGLGDTLLNDFNRIIVARPGAGGTAGTDRMSVGVDDPLFSGTNNELFKVNNLTAVAGDITPVLGLDGTTEIFRAVAAPTDIVNPIVYGNAFSSIVIENCNGPIYLRGICVDGALGGGDSTINDGLTILNSDVWLENISVIRCREKAYSIKNSTVNISRGLIGYRTYDIAGGVRNPSSVGVGFYAKDSTITFDTTQIEPALAFNKNDTFLAFSRNDIGMQFDDCLVEGGEGRSATATIVDQTWIQAFYNTSAGIVLNGTTFRPKARIDIFGNNFGLIARGSLIEIPEFQIDRNQSQGMILDGTTLRYNTELSAVTTGEAENQQYWLSGNGQNILVKNSSVIEPVQVDHMPVVTGRFYSLESHGISKGDDNLGTQHLIPSIKVEGQSTVELVHFRGTQYDHTSTNPSGSDGAIFGSIISADNSNVILRGSDSKRCLVLGGKSYGSQQYNAGIYGKNGSVIELTGPVKIGQFGIDVLVEDNSVLKMNPARLEDGSVAVSAWDLANANNHTKIELHSTRACLVANRNSTIDARDLGDFRAIWDPNASTEVTNGDYTRDGYSSSAFVRAGFLQFYPNPQHSDTALADIVDAGGDITQTADFATNQGLIASGGVCVRAIGNSMVNAQNVHFPMGAPNPDGIFFSPSTDCGNLFIWNIGDGSQLHASYLSVSTEYPSLAGYDGPSSVYTSGAALEASGALLGTADTDILSLLDYFGGPNTVFPSLSKLNQGCFRLYLGPDTLAKSLGYASGVGLIDGIAYQTFAQGYNPSTTLILSGNDDTYGNASDLSGWYYASAVLGEDNRYRIWLDESAANTFANAKHLARDVAGTGRRITVYKAKATRTGEGFDTTSPGVGGVGFYSANIFDLNRKN